MPQHIVVINFATPERAAELGQVLTERGMTPLCAGNTDELRRALNGQRVDLLILEHRTSGFLTGLEILDRLHAELVRPTTILLGTLSPAEKQRAEVLGVTNVVPSSIGLGELAEVSGRLLVSPQNAPSLPIPSRHAGWFKPPTQFSLCLRC